MGIIRREPRNGMVIVDPIAQVEEKRESGIIVPTAVLNKRGAVEKGVVHLADPAVKLSQGEIVFYRPGVGLEVELDHKKYLIVKSTDLALVEWEDNSAG